METLKTLFLYLAAFIPLAAVIYYAGQIFNFFALSIN